MYDNSFLFGTGKIECGNCFNAAVYPPRTGKSLLHGNKNQENYFNQQYSAISCFFGSAMVINIFNINISETPPAGLVYGILASAAYAFYNINADVKLKDFDALVVTFYTNFTTLAAALILHPGFFKFKFVMTSELLLYICELAVVSGILPVVFLFKGIRMMGADKASIVATSELPITILLSFLVLGERMGLVQLAGILLIMSSIIILQYEGILEGFFKTAKKRED